ncbi:uncharacterized protein si:dkey-196h17.9 [Labrus mixtus]|uniref:uncharacterized protein si:dkey-196h17.9 n=1 Tax=Labrus mixtus TaxID=508554 RepID=UPI0029C0E792|nr:uncharacterized protein si:dkey-196h17.9 [Labrus mixtus]
MFKLKDKLKRSSRRLLTDNNYNFLQEDFNQSCDGHTNLLSQNTFNTTVDQLSQSFAKISPQELAEVLRVGENTCVDGNCNSVQPEPNSRRQKLIIQSSVSQHFPKPPEDLRNNLLQHLENVKETVSNEIVRVRPLLECMELTGCLIDCYHRQTFSHLHYLLQNISSIQSSFVLLNWGLQQYMSRDHLDLPGLEPPKVDHLLFSDWFVQATDTVLAVVQADVKGSLEKILQNERNQSGSDTDEAFVGLYMDTIQYIDAIPKEAQKISQQLSDRVEEVCFKELLSFLERYTTEQNETLSKEAKRDKPKSWHFLKTLNSCKHLKEYVQKKDTTINASIHHKTVATLEKMEDFTFKLLLQVVSVLTERHLKNYFKSDNKHFFLNRALKEFFPKTQCSEDILTKVMDDAYEVITQIYLKHLLQRSQRKLQRSWSPKVAQTVTEDAELLHNTITELAPGVQEWNLMLLKVGELLECSDIEVVKVVAAEICTTWSEGPDLLPKLLRWKDLPEWKVEEVLDAIPGRQPRSVSCFSALKCC